MDMDYLRGNPNVLTEKLLEIQSKRDSLYVNTLRLTPLSASFKHAGEYLIEAGIICTDASSKEKRESQVKNALPEFWVRNSYVSRTKTQVDRAFEQLAWQFDTISRLITIAQMNNKIGNIARGELPFEPKEEVPFDPPYTESPKPEAKQQNTPVGNVDDNFVNRSMSQPLNSSKKFENLESFVSGTKPAKKTNQSITTGEIDW
jgi:hypothetical protein